MSKDIKEYTIMDGKTDVGAGRIPMCEDFTHAIVSVHTAGSTNCTLKFAGSISEVAPDFAAGQSPTNSYDFVQVKDLEDGSTLDGDTGLVLSGTDEHRLFEINTNALRFMTARITAISAGAVTVKVRLYNNY
jgi:hypothetical protein